MQNVPSPEPHGPLRGYSHRQFLKHQSGLWPSSWKRRQGSHHISLVDFANPKFASQYRMQRGQSLDPSCKIAHTVTCGGVRYFSHSRHLLPSELTPLHPVRTVVFLVTLRFMIPWVYLKWTKILSERIEVRVGGFMSRRTDLVSSCFKLLSSGIPKWKRSACPNLPRSFRGEKGHRARQCLLYSISFWHVWYLFVGPTEYHEPAAANNLKKLHKLKAKLGRTHNKTPRPGRLRYCSTT